MHLTHVWELLSLYNIIFFKEIGSLHTFGFIIDFQKNYEIIFVPFNES